MGSCLLTCGLLCCNYELGMATLQPSFALTQATGAVLHACSAFASKLNGNALPCLVTVDSKVCCGSFGYSVWQPGLIQLLGIQSLCLFVKFLEDQILNILLPVSQQQSVTFCFLVVSAISPHGLAFTRRGCFSTKLAHSFLSHLCLSFCLPESFTCTSFHPSTSPDISAVF